METLRFVEVSTHFPPRHLGGDAVFVEYLTSALMDRGHEVHVLHSPGVYKAVRDSRTTSSNEDDLGPRLHTEERETSKFGLARTLSFGTSKRSRVLFRDALKEIDPDIVHWHNTKGFINAPIGAPRAPTIYTAHDYYSVCPRSNLLRPGSKICSEPRFCQLCHLRWKKPMPLWRMNGNRVIRFPPDSVVVAPSEYMARRLGKDGIGGIQVVRNFVPDRKPLQEASMLENDLLLYVGMLEAHKGVMTLLRAFRKTKDQQSFRLVVVGRGSQERQIASMVDLSGLHGRVSITGFLPRVEVDRLIRRAAFQVIPSEWPENAPLSALEALSVGTPLLGSDLGGLPEILNDESGSMTFKGFDEDDLSRKLILLWNERHELNRRRSLARHSYQEKYTPEKHLESFMRLINEHRN